MKRTPVLLMGGMGNRLFQLARAIDIKRLGREPFLVEIEAMSALNFVANGLMGWSVHPNWLDMKAMAAELGLAYGNPTLSERLALFSEIAIVRGLARRNRLNLPLSEDTRTAQIGYFQGPGCLSRESLYILTDQLDAFLERPGSGPKIVLHARGADFALSDRLKPDEIQGFVKQYGDSAVCVTNDRKFVARLFPDLSIHRSKSTLEDFTAIARAKCIMPSNSTFCFWACAVAVLHGGARIMPAQRDSYWQLLSSAKESDAHTFA